MSAIQQRLDFPIRKTRSATKRESTSIENIYNVPVLRTPRRHRQTLVSSSTDSLKTAHCSPPKKHKNDYLELENNKTPTSTLCSPSKCLHADRTINTSHQISPRKSPRKIDSSPRKSPRKLDSSPRKSPRKLNNSPRKSPRNKENGAVFSNKSPENSPTKTEKRFVPVRLFAPDLTAYQEAKQAFFTGSTSSLHCRDTELKVIGEFLESHLVDEKPGSLYISGAPGTGKTASLNQILEAVKFQKLNHKCVFINCTNLKQPQSIYERIYMQLATKTESSRKTSDYQKRVTQMLSNSDKIILLILDEIDYLECKDQSVLYTIFEWPALENSKLVLIGIANALDLTDRTLPRLQTLPRFKPKLLHFPPYTKEQIVTILQERVKEISSEAQSFIKPNALQFCARKVASVAGDIRKALDVCRRAVELVEGEVRKQHILQPRTPKSASPSKIQSKPKLVKCVDLPLIASILNDIYGNQMANGGQQDGNALPLQQKILLCALFLIISNGKAKEVMLGKLHEVYSRICKKQQVTQVDQSEFTNICNLVEARGLLSVKKNKNNRLSKVSLTVNEYDLQFALQDKCLLASILTDKSCLTSSVAS